MNMWKSVKDEWPESDSEVVVYYFFEVEGEYGIWTAELMHEETINHLDTSKEVYWIPKPE
jgi:hypothetical protein